VGRKRHSAKYQGTGGRHKNFNGISHEYSPFEGALKQAPLLSLCCKTLLNNKIMRMAANFFCTVTLL
jgi:hypothetical protein